MIRLSHYAEQRESLRNRRILPKECAHHRITGQRAISSMGQFKPIVTLYDGAHLTRQISEGHDNRCLGIIFLLKFEKRVFDCIQLVFSVDKKALLPDFE